ncbi:MAG: hypothetical protein D6734_10340 [Candidatus Schekmanbacteria bacterium]|nr:MAG: hypothetical protein D6734_10340 [Candidatus Schekmanbacteria bacterium]
MKKELTKEIFKRISEKIELVEIEEFKDLERIYTLEGEEVGSLKAYESEKIEKVSFAEFMPMKGMEYINVTIKPRPNFNIPMYSFNYNVMAEQKKIQFDVDLYPAVDLAIRQDYIDKYYEPLTEIYLKEKNASYFNWRLSNRSWVRATASPYFFMSATDLENEEKVWSLFYKYLDAEMKIIEEEKAVSDEEAKQIAYRRSYMIKIMFEREPERKWLEKTFGKEVADKLARAMV